MEWLDVLEHAYAAYTEEYWEKRFQLKLAGFKV